MSHAKCRQKVSSWLPILDPRILNSFAFVLSPLPLPLLLLSPPPSRKQLKGETKARHDAAHRFWSKVDWGAASVPQLLLLRHKVCPGYSGHGTRLICTREWMTMKLPPRGAFVLEPGDPKEPNERQLVRSEIWIKRHLFDSPSRGCRQTIKQKTKLSSNRPAAATTTRATATTVEKETRTTLFDFKRIEFA